MQVNEIILKEINIPKVKDSLCFFVDFFKIDTASSHKIINFFGINNYIGIKHALEYNNISKPKEIPDNIRYVFFEMLPNSIGRNIIFI